VTLQVELVVPEGEVWSGPAEMVIAKTLDGDIGVLTGHTPVLGILAEGSVVRIRPQAADGGDEVVAAVNGGFFSVSNDRVSILAQDAQLGDEIDTSAARAALERALQDAQADATGAAGGEEPADVRYYRAMLRAAGDPADRA
jgi:F-type H+-transporting ATPase subunit epsilon